MCIKVTYHMKKITMQMNDTLHYLHCPKTCLLNKDYELQK